MLSFLIRRIASAIPTLFLLSTATFFLLRLAPGGPFDTDHVFPPEIQANLETRYGLHQPLPIQFQRWMEGIVHGDLSESFQYIGKPVKEIIVEGLPASLGLGLTSLLIAIVFGVLLGCLAAWKRDTIWDRLGILVALSGVSLPHYLVASLLVLVFSLWLGWLPPALWEGPSSAVLPLICLAIRPLALIARMVRASLIETLSADFIRTAMSKGVAPAGILFKHALRNSLIPVVSVLGGIIANLLTGSFLVEVVFQIPGLGKHFVNAVLNRDYPLVMGVMLVYGTVLILSQIGTEVLAAWLDPRIRLDGKGV